MSRCPVCDGAGFVRAGDGATALNANAARKDQAQIVCKNCSGLGKIGMTSVPKQAKTDKAHTVCDVKWTGSKGHGTAGRDYSNNIYEVILCLPVLHTRDFGSKSHYPIRAFYSRSYTPAVISSSLSARVNQLFMIPACPHCDWSAGQTDKK